MSSCLSCYDWASVFGGHLTVIKSELSQVKKAKTGEHIVLGRQKPRVQPISQADHDQRHRQSMIRYLVTGFPNSFKIVPKHSLVQELFGAQQEKLNLEEHKE